jgi:putative solute:sodium symporter small subunit
MARLKPKTLAGRAFVAGATLKLVGRPSPSDRRPVLHRGPAHRTGGNRPMAQPDSKANEEAHWQKTTRLMLTHLGIWLFFGYIIHFFVVPLNKIVIPILGFPLGFYMAAQGSLIVFVVMLFVFAKQQNAIDREFGYAEEDE